MSSGGFPLDKTSTPNQNECAIVGFFVILFYGDGASVCWSPVLYVRAAGRLKRVGLLPASLAGENVPVHHGRCLPCQPAPAPSAAAVAAAVGRSLRRYKR
eukprot:891141-Prorocentrum_minimum.AAC.1